MEGKKSNVFECLNVVTAVIRQWCLRFVVGIRSYIQNFLSSVHSSQCGHCTML